MTMRKTSGRVPRNERGPDRAGRGRPGNPSIASLEES